MLRNALLVVAASGLVVAAFAPDLPVLIAAVAVAGVTSVAAQVLVPFSASLAGDADRAETLMRDHMNLYLGRLSAVDPNFAKSVIDWS